MHSVVFYDLEEIDPELRQRAIEACRSSSVVEACAIDAVCLGQTEGDDRLERLIASRDSLLLGEAMEFWNSLAEDLPDWDLNGIQILSVMRYEWIYSIERLFYRAWVVVELLRRHKCGEICWVGQEDGIIRFLKKACLDRGVQFKFIECSVNRKAVSSVFISRSRLLLYELKSYLENRIWRILNKPEEIQYAESVRALVVLAENFPSSGSLVAKTYGAAFEENDGFNVLYLTGRKSIAEHWKKSGKSAWLLPLPGLIQKFQLAGLAKSVHQSFNEELKMFSAEKFHVNNSSINFQEYFLEGFCVHFLDLVKKSLIEIWQATEVFKKLPARAMISMTYASIFGSAMCFAAEFQGIPTVYVQHGLMVKNPFVAYIPHRLLLLWGDGNARTCIENGIPEERIRTIGMLKGNREGGIPQNPPLFWPKSGPVIVYFASRAGGSFVSIPVMREMLTTIHSVVNGFPESTLVVKLHPADHTNIAHKVLPVSSRVVITQDWDTRQLIELCDVAIVTSSTVGLEVCSMRKKLIMFDLGGVADLSDYEKCGAALCVKCSLELEPALRSILTNPEINRKLAEGQNEFSKKVLNESPIDASVKVVRVIQEFNEIG